MTARALAKGQLWKMNHAYVQIVESGKQLVQYKMMKSLGETWVKAKMSEIDTLWRYLSSRQARLVEKGAAI
jgi:hypothetical protein